MDPADSLTETPHLTGLFISHSMHKQSWRLDNIFNSWIKIYKRIKREALGGNFSLRYHKTQTTGVILYDHIAMFFSNKLANGYILIISSFAIICSCSDSTACHQTIIFKAHLEHQATSWNKGKKFTSGPKSTMTCLTRKHKKTQTHSYDAIYKRR